jgi:molybdopterin-biosynthesis enzyme MoeA-like protein
MSEHRAMGAVIIGDELLCGKRRDRHLSHLIEVLGERGVRLAWCRFEGDDGERLARALRETRDSAVPVFCFGGIGSTPDDRTRQAAAQAFDVPLVRHPEAVALIEQQFGEQAYPTRILMADLPEGCTLVPNVWNRIPGFSLQDHHFFPGFPQMAWPMLDWVLETRYPETYAVESEYSVKVRGVRESDLCALMEALSGRHPEARLFSLPHLGGENHVELGFRGQAQACVAAFDDLLRELDSLGLRYDRGGPD